MQEGNGKQDYVIVPTDEATNSSISKVETWLDSNSDEIIFTYAASSISPRSCIFMPEDDDDNAMQKADSNSSDDMEETVNGINRSSFGSPL